MAMLRNKLRPQFDFSALTSAAVAVRLRGSSFPTRNLVAIFLTLATLNAAAVTKTGQKLEPRRAVTIPTEILPQELPDEELYPSQLISDLVDDDTLRPMTQPARENTHSPYKSNQHTNSPAPQPTLSLHAARTESPTLRPAILAAQIHSTLKPMRQSSFAAAEANRISGLLNESLGNCACRGSVWARKSATIPIGTSSFKDQYGHRSPISVVTYEFALNLFKELSSANEIAKSDPLDGCYARAHRMAYQLEQKGVLAAKIMATGIFRLRHDLAPSGTVTWKFHVAPVVAVDDGETRSLWVLDPALFNEPTPVDSWLSLLTDQPKSDLDQAYLTSRFFYHPKRSLKGMRDAWNKADLKHSQKTLSQQIYKSAVKRQRGLAEIELMGLAIAPELDRFRLD